MRKVRAGEALRVTHDRQLYCEFLSGLPARSAIAVEASSKYKLAGRGGGAPGHPRLRNSPQWCVINCAQFSHQNPEASFMRDVGQLSPPGEYFRLAGESYRRAKALSRH